MPFYQEIMEEECQKVEVNDNSNAKRGGSEIRKKNKLGKDGESDESNDGGIDFNTEFQH